MLVVVPTAVPTAVVEVEVEAVVVVVAEVVGAAAKEDPDDAPFVSFAFLSPVSSCRLLAMQK